MEEPIKTQAYIAILHISKGILRFSSENLDVFKRV